MKISNEMLIESAAQALKNAYAPYSSYRVGAALLCADGSVICGCNIENASYGLTNCAERTAIFSAISQGHRNFSALALVSDGDALPIPCGACRQVLVEFCTPDFEIYCSTTKNLEVIKKFMLGELFPNAFTI